MEGQPFRHLNVHPVKADIADLSSG